MIIRRILLFNCFPRTYLLKENSRPNLSDKPENKYMYVAFVVLPHVREIKEKIQSFLNELDIYI